MALCLFATSCSNDGDYGCGLTTNEVTERFRSYFYYDNGDVKCNKLPWFSSTEWAVGANDGLTPLIVFQDITGMEVSFGTTPYDYRFVSSDGQCNISISGTMNADDTAEYATMKVSIPSCPEIETIHIGTGQYFNMSNGESVPVIFFD